MSAGVAVALSFLFYDRRELSAGRELFRGRYGIQGPTETAAEFRERTVEAFAPTIGGVKNLSSAPPSSPGLGPRSGPGPGPAHVV